MSYAKAKPVEVAALPAPVFERRPNPLFVTLPGRDERLAFAYRLCRNCHAEGLRLAREVAAC